MIQGTETKRKCTARCWNAKSKKCRCSCAGQNHGSSKRNERIEQTPRERISKSVFFASETRAKSGEVDFGVWWRDGVNYPTYRVSWIENTGELYAIDQHDKEIEVLGVKKTRADIEGALKGWADVCGQLNSLSWVRSQL